jgi:hypothetical protein
MHAGETKIQVIIDSQRQFVVPLFQRPYSWETPQWATLWEDLLELCEEANPRNHFIGSIVTMPAKSVPEGVTKFILIDGQQHTWDEKAIVHRGDFLPERALKIWPDFAQRSPEDDDEVADDEDFQDDVRLLIAKVVDSFGGEKERLGKGSRYICRVGDGKVLNIKYSRAHSNYYWFGLHASLWKEIGKAKVTHIVFILLPDAFVTVPVSVMKDYLVDAGSSPKSDGTIRHYHVLISTGAMPELFHHGKSARTLLSPYLSRFVE